ncbi:TPA: hypothetical protein JLI84_002306 [Escherichia coli]|nr:hypothetical protein [Escherichia coli]
MPLTAAPGGFFYSEFNFVMARYGGPFLYPRRFRRTSNNATQKASAGVFGGVLFYGPLVAFFIYRRKKYV